MVAGASRLADAEERMTTIAGIAGSIGAIAFTALLVLLLVAARGKPIGRLLMLACATSAL